MRTVCHKRAALISTSRFRGWCLYAKLVDYLALRKPVLALVPDPSEARTWLTRTNLGVFLDGEKAADKLTRVLADSLYIQVQPNEKECDRFTARRQTESSIGMFEKLL